MNFIQHKHNIFFSPPPPVLKILLGFPFLEDLYCRKSVDLIKEGILTVKLRMACDINWCFLVRQNELPLTEPEGRSEKPQETSCIFSVCVCVCVFRKKAVRFWAAINNLIMY